MLVVLPDRLASATWPYSKPPMSSWQEAKGMLPSEAERSDRTPLSRRDGGGTRQRLCLKGIGLARQRWPPGRRRYKSPPPAAETGELPVTALWMLFGFPGDKVAQGLA